jgi:hypothetical protein
MRWRQGVVRNSLEIDQSHAVAKMKSGSVETLRSGYKWRARYRVCLHHDEQVLYTDDELNLLFSRFAKIPVVTLDLA